MIYKLFHLVALFTIFTNGADHNVFKDCARIEFCTYLRTREPEEKYIASVNDVSEGTATFLLQASDDSEDLQLSIQALENNTFRLIINEVDSERYQLEYVLDGEPENNTYDNTEIEDDIATLTVGDNKIIVNFSPLSIQFYNNDILELQINGDRLLIENTESSQVMAFGVSFPDALRAYGLHEHAERLPLRTTEPNGTDPYRLKNLDTSQYELNSPMALYASVPLLYGHGPNYTSALFIHNAAEQWVEITNKKESVDAYFMIESGTLDIFVLLGPTPKETVRQYTRLTGVPHLPQLWTLGYHQCRWNYVSQDDVKDVVANFNNYNFPLDAIWLDIEYANGKRYFTWDPNNFGDPEEMQQNLSVTNKKLITIIDPHVKAEDGFFVYDGGIENDVFIKNTDGSVFEGNCWPGTSTYIDFYDPKGRDYYASLYAYDKFNGSTPTVGGIWNDMNEPTVFDDNLEKTLASDIPHYGGVMHRDIHNIYGLLNTMATHQGLLDRDNGEKRPFIITRSHFAGSQRFASIWTGDNAADWDFMPFSYSMCLTASLSGFAVCGADIGGFYNNPSEEMLQRWYQAGAWLTFYRAHADSTTDRREPYLFSEDVQAVIRDALELRYAHLPTWYTLFYEHIRNKELIIRPLFYQYPTDMNVIDMDEEILVGTDILVKPIFESEIESVQVYFPGGEDEYWISIDITSVHQGTGFVDIPVDINTIPVYYRRGSIIVRKNTVRLSATDTLDDPYTLYVILDTDNKAHGTVYLDDYASFKYSDDLEYNYISIDADESDVTFTAIDDFANSDNFEFYVEKIIIITLDKEPKNGQPGICKKTIHKTDINNNLLIDIKLNINKTKTLNLK